MFVVRNGPRPLWMPSTLHWTQHTVEIIDTIKSQFPDAEQGFWIMRIANDDLDTCWIEACRLYRERELPGIAYLKGSPPGRNCPLTGAIIFYCEPIRDTVQLERIGRNLVKKLKYKNSKGELEFRVRKSRTHLSTVFYTVSVPYTV